MLFSFSWQEASSPLDLPIILAVLAGRVPLAAFATGSASASVTTSVRRHASSLLNWRSNLAKALHCLRCARPHLYPQRHAASTSPSHWQSQRHPNSAAPRSPLPPRRGCFRRSARQACGRRFFLFRCRPACRTGIPAGRRCYRRLLVHCRLASWSLSYSVVTVRNGPERSIFAIGGGVPDAKRTEKLAIP